MNRYKDAPNKDMGEGLNTAFQKMKEWKLKPPVIEEDGNYIKVTIRHAPRAPPAEAILAWLETHPEITNAQARNLTGISPRMRSKKSSISYEIRGRSSGYPIKVAAKQPGERVRVPAVHTAELNLRFGSRIAGLGSDIPFSVRRYRSLALLSIS